MIDQKFGTSSNGDPIAMTLLFSKFICPTLAATSRFDLSESTTISEQTKIDLATASRILYDLVCNDTSKEDDIINQFIQDNHSTVKEKMQFLTDPDGIEVHKSVLLASVTSSPIPELQRSDTRRRIMEHFLTQNVPTSINTIDDMRATGPVHLQTLRNVVSKSDWKICKPNGGIFVFETKVSSQWREDHYIKFELVLPCPIAFVSRWLIPITLDNVFPNTHVRGMYHDGDFNISRIHVKIPFHNRESVRAGWVFEELDGTCWIPVADVPVSVVPATKNLVRSKSGCSGMILRKTEDGIKTLLTFVSNISGELASSWERKMIKRVWTKAVPLMKKKLEDGWRDPQKLPRFEMWSDGDLARSKDSDEK
eukprot:TRINITY_DN2213_c0_g2_i5.p1 TRINITY_DN2213_c0_g2~~TRINITY_DN2213_c0_g2_i5.p1  ORF type:complete len:366 (+),score=72.83 TRINITY_DN2213_c0_g2_i5:525-1622(+)